MISKEVKKMEDYIGKVCPFCKTEFKEGDIVKVCSSCAVPHHESCWEENKGCTTFGCSEQHHEAPLIPPTYVCPNCGTALSDEQLFCPKCGTPKTVIKKLICTKCGADLQDGQEFCAKCGQKTKPVIDTSVNLSVPKFDDGINTVNHKKEKKQMIIGIVIVVLAIAFAILIIINISKSVDDYLVVGNYEKAFSVAKGEEKHDVLLENIIAFLAKDIPDSLKDPSSFSLRDAWYDSEKQSIVLSVNGANSYGASISNYWYYTYDEDDEEYSLFLTLSDLDEEKIYSWDDTEERLEKILENITRKEVLRIIEDDSRKVDKDIVKNINNLFDEGLLENVTLLGEEPPSSK